MRKSILSNRGITMIEIMIGLVIIGIAASMAVPRFQKTVDRIQFRSTNRELISKIRMARSHAITEKNPYGVFLDGTNFTSIFFKKLGSNMTMYESSIDSVIKLDTLGTTPADPLDYVGTTLTNNAIVFKPDGSAELGGAVYTIDLKEEFVGFAVITILPSTGRVSYYTVVY
jgi:prepilin-type N-terminal cleavage/methylation domain-containing protein